MLATSAERPITIPEYFWDAMSAADRESTASLESHYGLMLFPSGSRFICPDSHSPESDFDVFAVGPYNIACILLENGWYSPDYATDSPTEAVGRASRCEGSISLYRDNINLILFFELSQFSRFSEATKVSRQLGLANRDDRVKVFKKICRE